MCGTTRDVFSQMRDSLQELQSSLRRKRGSCSESGDLGNEIIISSYMFSKKKLAKMIKSSKTMTTKKLVVTKDSDLFSVVTILNEVEEVTSEVFQSLLAFISGPKTRPGSSSIVSKLFGSRKVSCEGELEANNVELILVNSSNKGIKSVQVKQVLKGLESLEFNIQEFKEELECIFRQLMKTRVSILNIFNN
ncbi:uncharacterized protein LOC133811098 [Humulus lupulus]|uniref:uncharacterized protein LOC133806733 n=1 Tax=Humulus lupulus TaxID=3486 RepID=UPI002B402266|nr:uncharacterized protein LOC133806733 [Humulus lupulus]XP_062102115.1 uncharacterized protein LOC133811098 [Humulus lupulus]